MVLDVLVMTISGGLSMMLRFELSINKIPEQYVTALLHFLAVEIILTLIVFYARKMYHYVWRTVGLLDMVQMTFSVILAYAVSVVAAYLFSIRLPISVTFMHFMFQLILLLGMRCALRIKHIMFRERLGADEQRIMLIGAGEAGRMLLNELNSNPNSKGRVCCIIDDNPAKWGKQMSGVKIVGGREKIREVAREQKISQIIFAIPTASAEAKKEILNLCQETGCRVKTLPGIQQIVSGEVSLSAVKDVQVEDLLGRAPVQLDDRALYDFLADKIVLVTGGGGSIGSELCRQIARYNPKLLLVVDIYENGAYDLQQELKIARPNLNLKVEIGSVRDKERIYSIFQKYKPQIVFHAAAHKHVPLMEQSPAEAVKNNVFGTYHVVRAAEKFGVQKFVMISTDKAVNPTNFMGATKRFGECILQSRSGEGTQFCAVRFGNVLGSNGSVVPLFKRQIEKGGPVTITDKRIVRYFMLIPEAAQLVLEAGSMAKHGQIFVLDMGEPVKILNLAENLIRLSGKEPYTDIEIREVGLRPGEKLYEELLIRNDRLQRTSNEKIFVEELEKIDPTEIMRALEALDRAVTDDVPDEELVELMKSLVSTYKSPDEVNDKAIASAMA